MSPLRQRSVPTLVADQVMNPDAQCVEHGCARWRCDADHGPTLLEAFSTAMNEAALNHADRVARGKRQILADVREGAVPPTITSFAELHDHCDANLYGWDSDEMDIVDEIDSDFRLTRAVQDDLDAWIKTGVIPKWTGHEGVVGSRDGVRVTLYWRAPNKGERGWWVNINNPDDAIDEVLAESEDLGWIAESSLPFGPDENGMLPVTLVVTPAVKRVLVVSYDVSTFTEDEINSLTGEALAQAEASDEYEGGHPDTRASHEIVETELPW